MLNMTSKKVFGMGSVEQTYPHWVMVSTMAAFSSPPSKIKYSSPYVNKNEVSEKAGAFSFGESFGESFSLESETGGGKERKKESRKGGYWGPKGTKREEKEESYMGEYRVSWRDFWISRKSENPQEKEREKQKGGVRESEILPAGS